MLMYEYRPRALCAQQLGLVLCERRIDLAVDLAIALEDFVGLVFAALLARNLPHLLLDPRQMPGLVLGHAFEYFERGPIDVGQRRMGHVTALRALLDHHRQ